MSSLDVADKPGSELPLTADQFVSDMDALASYLAGRGLPLLISGHYRWMARYLASYFKNSKAKTSISIEIKLPLLPSLAVAFDSEGRSRVSSGVVLALAQVFDRAWQFGRSLMFRLAVSAISSIRNYARTNAVSSAPLVAAIVIVFFTGDSWKILGQGFDWQFCVLLGFFIVLSILGVADIRNLSSHLSPSRSEVDADLGVPSALSLSAALKQVGHELPENPSFSRLGMINAAIVYFGIIFANLLLVELLVSGALIVIGVIRINETLTGQLSGRPVHVLLRLPGGMVVTQELISLSLALGGLAILSFAFVTLSNRRARSRFASTATSSLRNVLVIFMIYRSALDMEVALTGVSSRGVNGDG